MISDEQMRQMVTMHKNRYPGLKALIVSGGPSAAKWEELYERLNPDVLIGVNGVGAATDRLDYWLCAENMNYPHQQALRGNEHYTPMMEAFRKAKGRTRIINRKSWKLLDDKDNLMCIRRQGVEATQLHGISFRDYDHGLINGARMQRPELIKDLRVGTVTLQAIHWAGLLGCGEVHTIGYDLCFKGRRHHWYSYPKYIQDGKYWYGNPFTTYRGFDTHYFWVDTVKYLREIMPTLERDEIKWRDHSDGLIQAEGIM